MFYPLFLLSVEIEWDGNGWLKGNGGQTGFYRVNYQQQQWDQLTTQLDSDHKVGCNDAYFDSTSSSSNSSSSNRSSSSSSSSNSNSNDSGSGGSSG